MTDRRAFGLRIRSELSLPGLSAADGPGEPDVTVRRGEVPEPDDRPAGRIVAWPGDEADVMAWGQKARLRVTAQEIVVDSADDAFARQCVLGPALGVLLHRRGRLVLHGSALDVGGRAVVLLGHKGAGKSTTAAALLARGHALLTDDLVALDPEPDGGIAVASGPRQMKLWPASAEALGLDIQPFMDGLDKGVWTGARMAEAPAPLGALAVLAWDPEASTGPYLDRLDGAAAFGEVFAHVYAPRFMGAAAATGLMAPCLGATRAVPVVRLTRPPDLAALGASIDLLESVVRE